MPPQATTWCDVGNRAAAATTATAAFRNAQPPRQQQ
jgi:hypothetical protein